MELRKNEQIIMFVIYFVKIIRKLQNSNFTCYIFHAIDVSPFLSIVSVVIDICNKRVRVFQLENGNAVDNEISAQNSRCRTLRVAYSRLHSRKNL